MRRKNLFLAMLFCVLCVSACAKTGSDNDSATERTGNEKESEKETETETEEETLYDYRNDENVLWSNINDQSDYDVRWINEVELYGGICEIYDGKFKTEGEERFGVSVSDVTTELTGMELYERYVKELNVKTEFYGGTEEIIKKSLDEEDEYRKNQERDYGASIFIFITEDELKKIVEKGCPEGMQIRLEWLYNVYE